MRKMTGRRRFENDRDYVHFHIRISFLFGAIIFLSQQQRHAHGFNTQQGLPKVRNESTSPRSRTRLHSHVMSTNGDFVRAVAENQLRGSAQEREDVVVAPPKFDFKSRYSINTRASYRMSEGKSASATVEYKRAASTPISRLLSLGKSGVGATVLTVLAVLGFWTSSSVIPLTSRNYPIVVNSMVSVPHNRMFSGLGMGGVLAKGVMALESVLTMEKILSFVYVYKHSPNLVVFVNKNSKRFHEKKVELISRSFNRFLFIFYRIEWRWPSTGGCGQARKIRPLRGYRAFW